MGPYAPPLPFGSNSLIGAYYNQNPQAALENFLGLQGGDYGSGTNLGKYVRSNFGTMWNKYLGMVPQKGANYSWTDYLNEGGVNQAAQDFAGLSPYQRGERPGLGQQRVRYLGF